MEKFKKNLVKFYVVSIISLGILIFLNSCKKTEIKPTEPTADVRILRTGKYGAIKQAEVVVSPISERFVYIRYELIGKDDGLDGNVVFKETFSDTIDLKYEENIIGGNAFVKIYKDLSGVYGLKLKNEKIILIPYKN